MGRSNKARRKRSTFRGGRGDNASFLVQSAMQGAYAAEQRSQRLLSRLIDSAASRTADN